MAFDITPHESVFRVVVGSQIVVPQHIKCHTNLEGNRKQLSYFSCVIFYSQLKRSWKLQRNLQWNAIHI